VSIACEVLVIHDDGMALRARRGAGPSRLGPRRQGFCGTALAVSAEVAAPLGLVAVAPFTRPPATGPGRRGGAVSDPTRKVDGGRTAAAADPHG
jgi:hypothetical protein